MSELREFRIAIDWHEQKRPELMTIIARDLADAKEIGRMLFRQSRAESAVIDVVRQEVESGNG